MTTAATGYQKRCQNPLRLEAGGEFFEAPCIKSLAGIGGGLRKRVILTLRYSWLLTAFCVFGMIFSPLMCLWLGVRGLSARVRPENQTVQILACYAAAAIAAARGQCPWAMPPRITAAVC